MARDTPITLYVEQETKDQLHREADDRDLSLSAYCLQLMDQARQADAQEELSEELNAEQRLLEIAATATEEIEQTAEEMRDMNAKLGVYTIANWELLKNSHPDNLRQDALRTGRNRLRTPLDDHTVDASESPDSRSDSTSTSSTSSTGSSRSSTGSSTSTTTQTSTGNSSTDNTGTGTSDSTSRTGNDSGGDDEDDDDDDGGVFDRIG